MTTDNLIDNLGAINEQIQQLEAQARKIKQVLIGNGVGRYEGIQYFADVQHYTRQSISPILVKELATKDFVAQVTLIQPVDAVVVRRVPV